MEKWIDFNAGVVAEGEDLEVAGQRLFDEVVAVASGKEVKSEIAGFHDMAIFKQGVTL
jgi:altronate hydrolase